MARFILVLRWILQGSGEDCGVVSDCEELVGITHRGMMWVFLCVGESIEKSGLCTITYILPNHTIKILFDYCHLPTAI